MSDFELPPLELQHAWHHATHKGKWKSIALVPATEDIQTLGLAHGFGQMAAREVETMRDPLVEVKVVNVTSFPDEISNEIEGSSENLDTGPYPYEFVDLASWDRSEEDQAYAGQRLVEQFTSEESLCTRAIFALDSLLSQTRTIPLCRTVDYVIICVAIGLTSFESVRQTVDIVGMEKVLGSIAIRLSEL
ncbi:MAG: hypothetical protein GY847_36535 [Proteobacteria bacterium]|nr:hypothetical protein [Pseudomonadota bacterium]